MPLEIRSIIKQDAEQLIALMKEIDTQTDFLRYLPGERNTTVSRIYEIIDNSFEDILVAEIDNHLIGYLIIAGNTFAKKKHTIEIVLGILEQYRGQGIGTQLITAAERWAQSKGIHRIELTVNTRNTGAFELYKKLGYVLEGEKKHVTLINGEYTDDYLMAKLI